MRLTNLFHKNESIIVFEWGNLESFCIFNYHVGATFWFCGHFPRCFQLQFVYINIAMCDLVHGVETVSYLKSLLTSKNIMGISPEV